MNSNWTWSCKKLTFRHSWGSLIPGWTYPAYLDTIKLHLLTCGFLPSLETRLLLDPTWSGGAWAQVGISGIQGPLTALWHCRGLLATSDPWCQKYCSAGSSKSFQQSLQMESCQVEWGLQMFHVCARLFVYWFNRLYWGGHFKLTEKLSTKYSEFPHRLWNPLSLQPLLWLMSSVMVIHDN